LTYNSSVKLPALGLLWTIKLGRTA